MSILKEDHRDAFELDAGICQYCNEDLLWSYSTYVTAKFDRIPASVAGWVTCCEACFRSLKGCSLVSFEARKAFVRQHSFAAIESFRATAERIRQSNKGLGIIARLIGAGLLRNGDVIFLEHLLPSFLQHQPGDPSYQAIVNYVPTKGNDVIYASDGCPYSHEFLTFDIFKRGHTNAPYRKTRFSWVVCPGDHWITKEGMSLTELQVKLDWDDLKSDEAYWNLDEFVEEAHAVLPIDEEFPVSFLQRHFRLGYARACRLYQALRLHVSATEVASKTSIDQP